MSCCECGWTHCYCGRCCCGGSAAGVAVADGVAAAADGGGDSLGKVGSGGYWSWKSADCGGHDPREQKRWWTRYYWKRLHYWLGSDVRTTDWYRGLWAGSDGCPS